MMCHSIADIPNVISQLTWHLVENYGSIWCLISMECDEIKNDFKNIVKSYGSILPFDVGFLWFSK